LAVELSVGLDEVVGLDVLLVDGSKLGTMLVDGLVVLVGLGIFFLPDLALLT